jgi:hypothetical protein
MQIFKMWYSTFYTKHSIVSLHICALNIQWTIITIWNKASYRISNTHSWSCATDRVHCCANVIQFFCGFGSYLTGNIVCLIETNQTRYRTYVFMCYACYFCPILFKLSFWSVENFINKSKYEISRKCVQWVWLCSMQKAGTIRRN